MYSSMIAERNKLRRDAAGPQFGVTGGVSGSMERRARISGIRRVFIKVGSSIIHRWPAQAG